MIERNNNIASLIDLFIRSLLKALCSAKEKRGSFEEAHHFYFDRGCQRTDSMSTCGQQNAPVASLGKIWTHQSNLIGIVKNQQPTFLALGQPVFNRFYLFLLICFPFYWKSRKQSGKCDKASQQGL